MDFLQALDAAVFQGNLSLNEGEKINFKFLKSGLGFFADGLYSQNEHSLFRNPRLEEQVQLELARLNGIEEALLTIQGLSPVDQQAILGKVRRIELPFSEVPPEQRKTNALARIQGLIDSLGLIWGGAPCEDALMPRDGFVNALTNAGDPHAMPGNEGSYSSVDAAIATNTPDIDRLNACYNPFIQLRESPLVSHETMQPIESPRTMANEVKTKLEAMILALEALKDSNTQLILLLDELIQSSKQFLDDSNFPSYKKACKHILDVKNELLNLENGTEQTSLQKIKAMFRAFFNLCDVFISRITGDQTMAETYTPAARLLVGRDHFLSPPKPKITEVIDNFNRMLNDLSELTGKDKNRMQ